MNQFIEKRYHDECKEEYYESVPQLAVGVRNFRELRERIVMLGGLDVPKNLTPEDAQDVARTAIRTMRQLLKDEKIDFVPTTTLVTAEGEVLEISQKLEMARKVEFNSHGQPRLVCSKNMFDWSPSPEALIEGASEQVAMRG